MNSTKNNVDALNAIVTVEVSKSDYAPKVEKVLADYRKNAAIKGFRKGTVPMSLIHKQYGKAVLLEEVNKVLQENLNKYLVAEKLDILGNPWMISNGCASPSILEYIMCCVLHKFFTDLNVKNQ